MGWGRQDGQTFVRRAGPLWLDASATGAWSVCGVDGGLLHPVRGGGDTPSHGKIEGATPDERLANAKAAAEGWCRSMARAVLAEVGDA